MNINWKQKLTSRKFWAAVIGFVTTILVALNYSQLEVEQVAGILGATATLIAYILAEGFVDGKRVENEIPTIELSANELISNIDEKK